MELKRKIPTQGGYIYCTAACSIDTSCIAFGTGDAMLRLWKLSEPHEITFDVTMFWQKIKGKLRAVRKIFMSRIHMYIDSVISRDTKCMKL